MSHSIRWSLLFHLILLLITIICLMAGSLCPFHSLIGKNDSPLCCRVSSRTIILSIHFPLFIPRSFSPPPMCINQYQGVNYSSLRVSYSLPHTSFLMEADNVCYSPAVDSFLYSDYRGEQMNSHRYMDDYYANTIFVNDSSFCLLLSYRFRMGMGIQILLQPFLFPSDAMAL